MKAFFGKIWAWVLANKVLSAIIAGATVVVLTVAIVVPVSVSASKKKKAAQEQETQQSQPAGDQGGQQGGGQQGGGGEGGGNQGHTHNYVFKQFAWKETPNAFTADAVYECADDHEETTYAATVTKLPSSVAATCENAGVNKWHAEYDGHEDNKDENVLALGHDWDAPEWMWTGLHTSATATFTCKRNNAHTHVETATFSEGGITLQSHSDATCLVNGHDIYRASVTFEGQTYTDDKDEVDYAIGHVPDEDNYGFCENCDEYAGTELNDTDVDYDFNNMFAGTYFYRFLIDEHYQYKRSFSGDVQESWFSFYAKYDSIWTPVDINGATYEKVNQPDDDYVYMVLNTTAHSSVGSFRIDCECAHNTALADVSIDNHSLCSYCGEFIGLTIDEVDFESAFDVPDLDYDETYFVRAKVSKDYHISLGSNDQWPQGCDFDFWLYDGVDTFTEVNDFNWWNMTSPRTSVGDFFTLDSDSSDGYLYIAITYADMDSLGDGCTITITTSHDPDWNSPQGLCKADGCDIFAGKEVSFAQFNVDQNYTCTHARPDFFRYAEAYLSNQKDPSYNLVQYKIASVGGATNLSFYIRHNGAYEAVTITDTYAALPYHPDETDPYIYVRIVCAVSGQTSGKLRLAYTI